ncbi:hypothetical protein [Streptomyces sp. NPDC088794]|uniref:DUF6197 family protein n=1 Tax=Streptomyces sp. NPDC088794 TaxID=3365902 RepID=UPI0037FAFA42
MTTTLLAPASPPPVLNLEARLAIVDAAMTIRLERAAVAFEVNTAHLGGADPVPTITEVVPLTPTLTPTVDPYSTPLASVLHRARAVILREGWCKEAFDDAGAVCPIHAIRRATHNRHQADDACVLLLEAIQRDFRDAETIPSWNAGQTSATPVLLAFDRAAQLAHRRGL